MPVLTGKVQEKTEKRTTNDDPFIAFKIDVGRKFPISVNDFELRGDHLKVGDQVSWEIEEEPGVIEGRNVTYRTLVAVRDADDGPDLTDMEYDMPPTVPAPQEGPDASPRAPAGSFNGMAFGNARTTHATLLAAWLISHDGRMWTPEERVWVWGEQLEGEMHLYDMRPE